MNTDEGFMYFVGLIILALSIGIYVGSTSIGFMIFGGGIVIASIASTLLRYLKRSR